MPILHLSGPEALRRLRTNTEARWPKRGADRNRIEPLARPGCRPTFSFRPGATVFTIGSCFARFVETSLIKRGFKVPTRELWQNGPDPTGRSTDNWILDNYGVSSILNELRWALDEGEPYDFDSNLVEVYPGRYADIHLPARVPLCSKSEAVERRKRIFSLTRSVAVADVCIVTLGLVEVWRDKRTGLYLNSRPYETVVRQMPDRFECHVLAYEDVADCLHEIMELILRRSSSDARIILTVSPVPMAATFTGDDVAVANQYSKSVLRAAAGAVARRYDRVDYFPSYETVVLSERQLVWEDDLIHVREAAIEANVDALLAAYVESEAPAAGEASSERASRLTAARELLRRGQHTEAIELARQGRSENQIEAVRLEARALLTMQRYDDAEAVLKHHLEARYNDAGAHGLLSEVLAAQDKLEEAVAAAERAVSYAPHVVRWIVQWAKVLVRLGRTDEGRAILVKALEADPKSVILHDALSSLNVEP